MLTAGRPKSLLVEGGGSHTWVAVADGRTVWAQATLPSLNRIGASPKTQRALLADVAGVAERFPDIEDVLFAVGAACTGSYLDEFAELLAGTLPKSLRPARRTYITNDVVPLFFAEDRDGHQLVVIAGTGSGVAARRGFEAVARHGAHEYLLGDDGGAYDIGRRALRAVIAHSEGRGERTSLTALVAQRTRGVEIDRFVYGAEHPKQTVADFARDVFTADAHGDRTAGRILDGAAARLADVCRGALKAAGATSLVTATFTGSLLTEPTGRLRRRLEQHVRALGVTTLRYCAVDLDLMRRTVDALRSDRAVFDVIADAVPAVRL
ncbi:BadF/BadG/BcrA/BcrD ATPase family protein [Streptomyces sp. NPDC006430]|uniref:BadF/BadG/BcrA/BcrD ATPase family protein n=1 Tax=Streptomyces sp. NPDC006430 TaxID=3154299 RepID=UPI0033AD7F9B